MWGACPLSSPKSSRTENFISITELCSNWIAAQLQVQFAVTTSKDSSAWGMNSTVTFIGPAHHAMLD